jgi:hypothetical protein
MSRRTKLHALVLAVGACLNTCVPARDTVLPEAPRHSAETLPAQQVPVHRPLRIERAAALSPTKVFAVVNGRLWHTVTGGWSPIAIAGTNVRDVTAAAGSLWVLTRGTGPNAGHVTILRSSGTDDLGVAFDFVTAPEHDPRVLTMVNDREFYVGGSTPPLLRGRTVGTLQTTAFSLSGPVTALLYMPDSMMYVRYENGTHNMFRWGEVNAIERPGYLFSFSGARASLMVMRDGSVWGGRVWEQALEHEQLSTTAGMVPVAAATLRDERVVIVDANGRARLTQNRRWVDVVVSNPPAEVVGFFGARSLVEGQAVLVDRNGSVYELVENHLERRITGPTL